MTIINIQTGLQFLVYQHCSPPCKGGEGGVRCRSNEKIDFHPLIFIFYFHNCHLTRTTGKHWFRNILNRKKKSGMIV
jgi:hypothetical protein